MTPEQEQLLALIAAAEADPSEIDALIEFIEQHNGDSIDNLTQPTWDQVLADGVTRDVSIVVVGYSVTLTLTGDLVTTSGCDALETWVAPLGDNDFTMPTVLQGSTAPPPSSGSRYVHHTFPDIISLHIDNPRLVWLAHIADEEILDRIPGNQRSSLTVGGLVYAANAQIGVSYTARIAYRVQESYSGGTLISTNHTYANYVPLLGFHYEARSPENIDEPFDLSEDYATWGSRIEAQRPSASVSGDYWLKDRTTGPTVVTIDLNGTGNSEAAAWSDYMADVAQYEANRTAYDPVLSVDESAKTITVEYLDRANAFYVPVRGCTTSGTPETTLYNAITINYGGWVQSLTAGGPVAGSDLTNAWLEDLLERLIAEESGVGVTNSQYRRLLPEVSGTYVVEVSAAFVSDGKPPDTVPNTPKPPAEGSNVPVPPPVSGGCRSGMDTPSSCDWNVPLPEPNFEDPELNPDFPLPGDFPINDDFPMPEMPIFNANYPEFPEFCLPPNFGQMTDCKPQPGSNHVPGGRDRRGRRGKQMAHIKQGGATYGIRENTFEQDMPIDPITDEPIEDPDTGEPLVPPQRCWPASSSIMTAITTILLDLGVSPLNIVWEVGPEWDKTFGPHCFPETTGMFDAAVWLAQKLMLRIIDEGEPSYKVYIGPPTHRPASQTFTFQDTYYPGISTNPPFANLAHGYSSSEAYFAVKVWGSHLSEPAWAIVDTPFAKDPTNILEVQVGPNYSFAEAQELAFFRAALIRRAAVSVQVTVPYSENYYMRDTMILQVPSAGYQETFTIFAKQSEVSVESKAHILTGVLPATLAELDQFPEVLEEPVELGASFLDWPRMRSATKRKGERRLKRHLARRERRLALH